MAKDKVLIIEDDEHIARLIDYNLDKAGFACTIAISGETGLELLRTQKFDCLILDIMLPGIDGFAVCKQIRTNSTAPKIPIIMLTARGEEIDRILGFELGVDDYVVKPFSPREFVLRVRAVLRRHTEEDAVVDRIQEGKITVDFAAHEVYSDKKKIDLTLMEFNLLVTLMKRKGRVQSRETLLEDVWDISAEVTTRTIDTHIKRLRQKLGKHGDMIETVRGIGYRFLQKE